MILAAALVACSGGSPGAAPTADLWWVREGADGRRVCRGLDACLAGSEGSFPGPAHGARLLLVRAADGPDGHVEQLGLAEGGAVRWLTPPGGRVRSPAWAPDGRSVVIEGGWQGFSDLYVVGLDGGAPRPLVTHPAGNFEPDVHPSGRVVFASSRDGDVELYEVPLTGGAPRRRTTAPGEDTHPLWSPDGRWLAWRAWRGEQIRVWLAPADPPEAPGRPLLPDGPGEHRDHAWSPDGRRLAVVEARPGEPDKLLVVDLERGGVVASVASAPSLQHPAWAPDGGNLAVTHTTRTGARVLVTDGRGGPLIARDTGPEPSWLPRWMSR